MTMKWCQLSRFKFAEGWEIPALHDYAVQFLLKNKGALEALPDSNSINIILQNFVNHDPNYLFGGPKNDVPLARPPGITALGL